MSRDRNQVAREAFAQKHAPQPLNYEVDVLVTLVDGSEQKKHVSLRAFNDQEAAAALSQVMRDIVRQGVLTFFPASEEKAAELVLDPTPSQIKSVRAAVPKIALAVAGVA